MLSCASTARVSLTVRPVNAQASRPSRAPRTSLVTKAIASEQASAPADSKTYANQLEALKAVSTVVADTGEIESIRAFRPVDSTTNPSLVLKAVQNPQYEHFLNQAISEQTGPVTDASRPYANIADALAVNIGCELLKIVPGRVSTEVDAHLSFDTQATVDKALRLVDMYSKKGIDTKRIYIKMASTWEGIRACEILQKQDIDCNLTLLFSFAQAGACADAGAALISPFVGRILDWYKKNEGKEYAQHEDPGVQSVQQIYKYYKKYGYKTIVMAASFRNIGEIQELAGCDNITISPPLLQQLADCTDPLPRKLWPSMGGYDGPQLDFTASGKALYEEKHNSEQMAVDKLKEGIDGFAADQRKLEAMIGALIADKK